MTNAKNRYGIKKDSFAEISLIPNKGDSKKNGKPTNGGWWFWLPPSIDTENLRRKINERNITTFIFKLKFNLYKKKPISMNPEIIKKDRIWIKLDTFRSSKNEVLDTKISAIFITCIKPLVA